MKTKEFIKDDITSEDHLDHEVRMAKSDLLQLTKDSIQLIKLLNQFASEERGIPGWVASKITKAQDYISAANKSLTHDAAEDGQIHETASVGATSSSNIATVVNPHVAHSKKKPKKQKPTDNALDMKGTSIFGGPLKR